MSFEELDVGREQLLMAFLKREGVTEAHMITILWINVDERWTEREVS